MTGKINGLVLELDIGDMLQAMGVSHRLEVKMPILKRYIKDDRQVNQTI